MNPPFLVEVQCLQLYQSAHMERQARAVVLQAWNGKKYVDMFRFDATAGTYMQRPAPTDIIWRISNYNSVAAKWQVSELHFFEDIVCADELEGGVLSSIGVRPDAEKYGSIHAFKP